MPREKQTKSCQHCGKAFVQARKDQKYCSAPCRFDHFFDRRDNEKAQLENENAILRARVSELEAQLQAVPPSTPKRRNQKVSIS
jgi:hypothetical protein